MKTTLTMLLLIFSMAVFSQTVIIGTQEWTTANLNVGTMIPITQIQTDNNVIERYCYNNLESNCNIYGALYRWEELMAYSNTEGSQGICPDGFRVPTRADYALLVEYLGGSTTASEAVKELQSANHWQKQYTGPRAIINCLGNNSSGFTALGGGKGYSAGTFGQILKYANLWTSSTYPGQPYWVYTERVGWNAPFYEYLDYIYPTTVYLSARCIKN